MYTLILNISRTSHLLLIYITMWIEWLTFKLNTTTISIKTSIRLWVHTHNPDRIKFETRLSLHLFSLIRNPQYTTNDSNILSGSTLMVPEASQSLLPASALWWQLQCPHSPNKDTTILECWCCCHSRIEVLLFSWSVLSLLRLCVLHIHFCDLNPVRASAFWIPVEMYRSPTSTTSGNFLLQFQTGQSWNSKFLNSSHSPYLLNLFC